MEEVVVDWEYLKGLMDKMDISDVPETYTTHVYNGNKRTKKIRINKEKLDYRLKKYRQATYKRFVKYLFRVDGYTIEQFIDINYDGEVYDYICKL